MLSTRDVDRGIEPQPAIEIGVAASILVPSFGRLAQLLVHEELGALLRDPGAEARPRAQERLVHERDLVAIDDEQTGIGERRDDISSPARFDLDEFTRGSPSASVFAIRPQLDHAQDDAPRDVVAFVVERRDRTLRRGRDRGVHTARLAVTGNGDATSVAARPGFAQRMAEEGKGARRVAEIGDDEVGEPRFDDETAAVRAALRRHASGPRPEAAPSSTWLVSSRRANSGNTPNSP